jgi:hypothetical protein
MITQPAPPSRLLSILSDQPADEDQLNFAPYAKTLADIIVTSQKVWAVIRKYGTKLNLCAMRRFYETDN